MQRRMIFYKMKNITIPTTTTTTTMTIIIIIIIIINVGSSCWLGI